MASCPPPTPPSFSLARKFGAGVELLIACLSVVAVVGMLNYLAARHYWRHDLSAARRATLSDRTLRVLGMITNEVKIIVYYEAQERLFKETTDLLREYTARNPHLKLQVVDPVRNPAEAHVVRNRYDLAALNQKNLVLFDSQGKTRVVYQQALSDYDLEAVEGAAEREFRRRTKAFRGEQQFTSALISVISPRQYRAYFLQGHGEHDPLSADEVTGYSRFARLLTENNMQPAQLSLLGSEEVPADCSLLIIAGPVTPFSAEEQAKLERYLSQGGRLLVLFSYRAFGRRLGLEALLAGWGVVVGENVVLDTLRSTPHARGQDLILPITEKSAHAITRPLAGQSLHLLLPRSVSAIKSGGASAEVIRVDELLHTTEGGVLVRTIKDGLPELNPARDPRGAFSLIAAVERGAVPGVRAQRGATRILVAGDSSFLSNQMIESMSNRDFGSHAVNWLLDQSFLVGGIGPREVTEYRLNLTRAQMLTAEALLLGAAPGAVLLLGALVWWRRRK